MTRLWMWQRCILVVLLLRLAAVLVATTHWLVWSALSGMEILLFTCLSLWGVLLHLRGQSLSALPVLGLACLARPEGYLLLAAAVAECCPGAPPADVPPWCCMGAALAAQRGCGPGDLDGVEVRRMLVEQGVRL